MCIANNTQSDIIHANLFGPDTDDAISMFCTLSPVTPDFYSEPIIA